MPYRTSPSFVAAGPRSAHALHRILVVGGGAGGLELAVRLGEDLGRRGKAEILLVDPQLTHLWKPLLHEVAAGTLSAEEGGLDFLQQAQRHHFRFHLGALDSLDRLRKEVRLSALTDEKGMEIAPERSLWYDTLVIAIGSQDNDFGIPGVKEHAFPLNGQDDAHQFHRRLLALCTRSELQDRGPIRIVIVGAGATGVELAAELTEATQEIASFGPRLKQLSHPAEICIVDVSPRLLAALPQAVADKAREDLLQRGIQLRLGRKVVEVKEDRVILAGEKEGESPLELPADVVAWAAGIRVSDALAHLDGLESNRLNQLVVNKSLQTTRDVDIFVLGDCASCVPEPGAKPVPPLAQAAHQEARFLARALRAKLEGKALPEFNFHQRGSLVSLGQTQAVGEMVEPSHERHLLLEGVIARFSYWMLYRRHLLMLLGLRRTLLTLMSSWFSGKAHPRVKLH